MKKYILISAIILTSCLPAFAQPTESQFIDSLKKQSLALKGAEKVDCLNLLAREISSASNSNWKQKADSVYKFASMAYEESKKHDYRKGLASSLTNLALSEYLIGLDLRINKQNDDESNHGMEKYLSQSIPIAEQAVDHETLGNAYELWGDMLYQKSKSSDNDSQSKYRKKSMEQFALAGNIKREGEVCTWLSESYYNRGYYEEAFDYCNTALKLNEKALSLTKHKGEKSYRIYLYWQSLVDLGDLYKTAGDYNTSLNYFNKSEQFALANEPDLYDPTLKAAIFRLNGNYDSSFYYLNKAFKEDPDAPFLKVSLGETYLLTQNYDSALVFTQQAMPALRKRNVNGRILIQPLLIMGSAYSGKNEYIKAMPYSREGMGYAKKLGTRPEMMKGYKLLSEIYRGLGNNDSAYQYLLQYIKLKDSIQNRQFLFRLTSYQKAAEDEKKQAQILLLNKDNKIKDQQLKQESLIRNFLMGGLLALMMAGIFIYRTATLKRKNEKLKREQLENAMKLQQLENEKRNAELQQQAAELEMQALRAQMNPHFIFNCLSSINRIILKNESQAASDYLTRFSRLIRMVLINSQKAMIALEDELQMLRLYLDMERLRFKNSFDYSIIFTNTIDEGAVFIPPLLLQPFCENAIWHGLMQKEGQGYLNIELSMQDNILHCIISDDGIGREKAAALKSKSAEKEKSMGLAITAQRLALLNQNKNVQTFYTIEDNRDADNHIAGTKVILKIAYKELEEQIV